MVRITTAALAVLAGAALLAGCGGEQLNDVSGTITYDGNPIPKGIIFFDPAKGTPGTSGNANIENGKYNTGAAGQGKGVRGGGKYHVRILGYTGVPTPDYPFGKELFPEYTFTHELPAQAQTFDYDVKKGKK